MDEQSEAPNERELMELEIRALCEKGDIGGAVARTLQGYGRELLRLMHSVLHQPDAARDAFSLFSENLLKGLPKGDPANPAAPDPTLKAAADFVNTGYDVTAFPTDPDLLVSSGPMVPTGWTPGQSFTMERNKYYVGGMIPKIDKIVLRVIPDANAQVTALQNGEVDIINPQASADTLTALENTGADVLTGDQVSYDHLDLTMDSEVFSDPAVREAFLKTIEDKALKNKLDKERSARKAELNRAVVSKLSAMSRRS